MKSIWNLKKSKETKLNIDYWELETPMVKESGKENGLIKVKNYKTHSLEIKS